VIADESIEIVKKQIESKASTPYEAVGRRKEGNRFPILCHAKMIKYQGSQVRVVAISDLSYQKKSEQALRESEEKFRTVSEKSPNMIFINQGGKIVYVNQKCKEMMGYQRDAFYAPDFDFLTLIAPESIETVRSSFKKHIAGQEVAPYEYSLINKMGQRIEVIITTKLINFEGDPAILGIVTDISERKKAENDLKERDKRLEQQAQHLEEVNTALKVLLEHREQEKQELEENLLVNIKKLVFPYLEKLDKGKLGVENQTYLNIVKTNLNDLISPLANRLSSNYLALTPTELQITDFIKHGKTSKEIAAMLHVSAKAVAFHRGNIRKKLGLTNKKINLQTYLQSFPQ
jgi:PAS domain S-box-containing protein